MALDILSPGTPILFLNLTPSCFSLLFSGLPFSWVDSKMILAPWIHAHAPSTHKYPWVWMQPVNCFRPVTGDQSDEMSCPWLDHVQYDIHSADILSLALLHLHAWWGKGSYQAGPRATSSQQPTKNKGPQSKSPEEPNAASNHVSLGQMLLSLSLQMRPQSRPTPRLQPPKRLWSRKSSRPLPRLLTHRN